MSTSFGSLDHPLHGCFNPVGSIGYDDSRRTRHTTLSTVDGQQIEPGFDAKPPPLRTNQAMIRRAVEKGAREKVDRMTALLPLPPVRADPGQQLVGGFHAFTRWLTMNVVARGCWI